MKTHFRVLALSRNKVRRGEEVRNLAALLEWVVAFLSEQQAWLRTLDRKAALAETA